MDNNGQQWKAMDKYGQQWATMDIDNNGQQCTTMHDNGQQWTTMDSNGQQWTLKKLGAKNTKKQQTCHKSVILSDKPGGFSVQLPYW